MVVERHHALSYIEFGVTDLQATRVFYESVFGWEFNDYGPNYSGIKSPDGAFEVGGLNPHARPSETGPLVLIFSHDLDATVQAVESAGGTIIESPYAFPGGRRFEFIDPSGNRLGVYAHQ
ncbi:MAG TPA: VOC family protein [Enteractinococcus sp.]